MLTQHVLLQMILVEELLTTRGTNKRLSKLVIVIAIITSTLLRFTLILHGRRRLLTLLLTTQNTINRVIMRLLLQLLLQYRLIRNQFISITIRLLYLNLLIE